jgi:transposase
MKDFKDRERILEKVKKTIGEKSNPKKLITNAGVKKFVAVNDDATVVLDENKIEQAAAWDGLHGIITNIKDDSPASLIARYARLWVIEESFRVNKHTLEMRPIFHWAPLRIHAHIAICYMTFSVLRHLQYRVNLTQKISIDNILDELMSVQASIYIHKKTKNRYRVPGSYSNDARKIYKAFDLERSQDATIYQP